MKKLFFLITYALLSTEAFATITASIPNPVCPNRSITLTSNMGSWQHYWRRLGSSQIISQTNPITILSSYRNETYQHEYKVSGVSYYETYTVVVEPLQALTPSGPSQICNNTATSIVVSNATYASTYNWQITPIAAGSISGTGESATINWNRAFIGDAQITVSGINASTCSTTVTGPTSIPFTITKKTNDITILPSSDVTNNNCIQLSGDPSASSYLWSTNETTNNIIACNTNIYTLTTTYSGGLTCQNTASTFVSDFSNTMATPNGKIYSIYENSGKLYLGGDFDYVGMVSGNSAQVDNSTGSFDSNMPRINGAVNCVIPDGSGGWFVGGLFTKAGVYNYKNLIHLNADKSVDAAFKPEPNGEVKSLLLVGNKIYVAGSFTMVGEVSRGYLAQIDISNGMASSWDPMVNGEVASIALYNNNIIAGGNFTSAGGLSRNHLAAIDTVYAQSSTFNPNPDNTVNKVVVSGTKLYVAGSFSNIAAGSRNKLACILLTTETLTSWNPNPNNTVYDIQPTLSSIYVCGDFTSIGGQARNYLASLNTSAGTALTWNPNPNNSVYSLLINGSEVIAGGKFTLIGSNTRNYLANISSSTGLVNAWNPDVHGLKGSTPFVKTISLFGSNVFVGGSFYSLGGQTRNNAACIDKATGQITTWNPNVNNVVRAIYADNNHVYIGGEFTQVNGFVNKNRIAQLGVSNAVATGWNPNSDGIVHTLAAKGQYLYAGGEFANIGNNPRPKLAAIKLSDGTSSTWNPSPNNTVRALSIMGDNLYIGGDFTTIGGQARNRIAAYGITSAALLNFNPNADNVVNAIATKNDKIYVGGSFTNIGGATRRNFAIFNPVDGSINSVNPSFVNTTSINAVDASDSVVYIGGINSFYNNNSLVVNKNASAVTINDGNMSSYWHPEPNGLVRSICVLNDKIFLGGDFTEVMGVFQPFLISVDNYCVANAHVAQPFTNQFCEGDGVYLNADTNSHYSYQWYLNNSPIAGADSSSYSPRITGLYNVKVTDNLNYGSVFSNYISVTVDQLADSSITTTGATTFCGTGNVTLTAATGTGYSYQWYKNGSVINGQTTNSYIATTGGTYFCEILNSSGCSRISQKITILSNSLTPVVTNNSGVTSVCQGQSVNLTSSYSSGNLWYKDNVSTGITTQSFSASQSGVYKLYVLNGSCSGFSSEIAITVNPLPSNAGAIVGTTSVCQSQNAVTYTVPSIANATSYIWSLPSGATGTSSTNSITLNYGSSAVSGNITVNGSNTCGNGTLSTLAITVNQVPQTPSITAGGPTSLCNGGSVSLSAPSGFTYLWSNGSTNQSITVSSSGLYTVQTISGTCTSAVSQATQVTVNPAPQIPTITASGSTSFCQGGSVTLSAPAGLAYLWSNGQTTSSINVNSTGSYTVQTISNGCTSAVSQATQVTVNQAPQTPTITASGSTTFCTGGSVTLSAPSGLAYLWNNGQTTSSISVNTTGSYTVQTISNGCTSAVSQATQVTVNQAPQTPTISASGSTTFCSGGSVTLSAPSGLAYLWSNGQTTSSISVNSTGSYTVQTISNGCTSAVSQATQVTLLPDPFSDFTYSLSGTTVQLNHQPASSPDSLRWNFGDGQTSTETNPLHFFETSGIFNICLTTYLAGCSSQTCKPVQISVTTLSGSSGAGVKVVPNPSRGLYELSIENLRGTTARIEVLDALGRQVYEGEVISQGMKTQQQLDIRHVAAGVYTLLLQTIDGPKFLRLKKE